MTTDESESSILPEEMEASPERLRWALDFTPEDLEANREGKMSEMQHYRLRVRRRQAILTGVGIIFMFIVAASVLIFMGREYDSNILTYLGIAVTLANAAMSGIFARYWLRINADIQSGEVRIIQGELERVVKPITRRVINMIIRVDDFETIVNKEVFESFTHEHPYRIYATPNTGMMLSAEALA